MKKLLLASILMAFGAPAYAAVTVGTTNCSVPPGTITCNTNVTCSAGNCDVSLDFGETVRADCLPIGSVDSDDVNLISQPAVPIEDNPICVWNVTDGDGGNTVVTVNSDDGLPVELQSLSVE
jgi:hypothetical protein